jgi:hypothetical protein
MQDAVLHSLPHRRFGAWVAVGILVLAGLSRVPQLASPHLFFCGDEAIVGLMAERVLSGDGMPLFFYGQSYMLAIVEVLSTTLSLGVVGTSPLALKLGGLMAWALGLLVFVMAVRHLCSERMAVIVGVLFLCIPAWAPVGQMYTGAFVTSSLALWLIARLYAGGRDGEGLGGRSGASSPMPRNLMRFALGFVLSLLYFIHPLWIGYLLPFLPLVLVARAQARPNEGQHRAADLGISLVGLISGLVFILLLAPDRTDYWSPPILQGSDLGESLIRLPQRWFEMLSGHYFLNHTLPMGRATSVATLLWTLASLAAMGGGLVALTRGETRDGRPPLLPLRCLFGIVAVSAFSLLTNPQLFGARYLLPLTPSLILLVAWAFDQLWQRGGARGWVGRIGVVALALLVLAGSASLYELRLLTPEGYRVHEEYPEAQALRALLEQLEGRDVQHFYSTDSMLQWSIMFSALGPMRGRWLLPTDRVPEYPLAVDRALWSGAPVALVGRIPASRIEAYRRAAARSDDMVLIEPHYYVRFAPRPEELESAGFSLNPRP